MGAAVAVAAAVAGGLGLLGTGINAVSQNKTNQANKDIQDSINDTNFAIANMTNSTNRELAYLQNEWNLEQWHRENAYNHPAAQADRLRSAGLSAAAAAQGVNGGNASHLESANLANQVTGAPMQAATMQAPNFNLAEVAKTAIDAAGGAAQAAKSVKETQLMEEIVVTDLDAKRWATQMTIQQYFQNQSNFPHQNRMLQYQADSAYWRSKGDSYLPENMRMANLLQKQTFDQSEYTFKHVTPLSIQKLGHEINNIIEEGKKLRAQTDNIEADTQNKQAQNSLIQAQTENTQEDTNNKKLDGFYKRMQNAYCIGGLPNDSAGRMATLVANGVITPQQSIDIVKHGKNFLETSGKVFGLSPDLKRFYNYTINPSAFEHWKLESGLRRDFESAKPSLLTRIGENTEDSQISDTSIDKKWQNVK